MPVDVPYVGKDIDPHAVYHLNTVADAKEEWMCQLVDLVGPRIIACFQRIAACAPRVARRQNMDTMECYMGLLDEVPKWNTSIIQDEVRDMFREDEEATVYDVLKACYVATTVVMASIRTRKDDKELQIAVPKVPEFVHGCCVAFKDRLLSDPMLVVSQGSGSRDRAYKRDQLDRMVNKCVRATLRAMLPVKQMMRCYLDDVLVEGDAPPPPPPRRREKKTDGAAAEEEEEEVPLVSPGEEAADEAADDGREAADEVAEDGGQRAAGASEERPEEQQAEAAAQAGGGGDDEPIVYRSMSRSGGGLASLLRDVDNTTTTVGGGDPATIIGGEPDFEFWPQRNEKVVDLHDPPVVVQ